MKGIRMTKITNPCDMPYKLPRRRTFEVAIGIQTDGIKRRKTYFKRVKANNAFDAFAVTDGAILYCGQPIVIEIKR